MMILFWIGMVLYFIGAIGILIEEFKESIIWGLFGLFTQIANILFAILYFDRCKKYLGLILAGIAFVVLGCVLSGN